MPKIRLFSLSLLLLVVLVGCRRANIESVERNPDGGFDVTATLDETAINDAVEEALARNGNPLLRDPQIDLQDGQIYITGQHDRRDGSGTVSGNMTLTLSIQDGRLLVQATSLNIDGLDNTDEQLASFNERLAEGLTRRADRRERQITMLEVGVTDEEVRIKFNVVQE